MLGSLMSRIHGILIITIKMTLPFASIERLQLYFRCVVYAWEISMEGMMTMKEYSILNVLKRGIIILPIGYVIGLLIAFLLVNGKFLI